MTVEALRDACKRGLDALARPLGRGLLKLGVTPTVVTLAGLALAGVCALLILLDEMLAAGVVLLVAGGLDLLDGAMARAGRRATDVGAFLDSTLDRLGEGLVFAALIAVYAQAGWALGAGIATLALLAGQLVSYTRARAEALGAACRVGLATRGERVLILVAGLAAGVTIWAVGLILVLSAITVGQRVRAAHAALSNRP